MVFSEQSDALFFFYFIQFSLSECFCDPILDVSVFDMDSEAREHPKLKAVC